PIDGMVAQIALTRAQPEGLRVLGRELYRTDRARWPVLEKGLPTVAAVDGLPEPASGRAEVIDIVIAGHSRHRRYAPSRYRRPDVAERNVERRRHRLRVRRNRAERQYRYQSGQPDGPKSPLAL